MQDLNTPTLPATKADLDDFHEFALEQIARYGSQSFVQLVELWTFKREIEEADRQIEQGNYFTIEELTAECRARIAAVRAQQKALLASAFD